MSIGQSAGAGAGSVEAGVEGAAERAQAVRAEERGGGLRLYSTSLRGVLAASWLDTPGYGNLAKRQ